jgi:RNA polymerase sigma-70 factor (ECF subfamily)
MRVLSGEREWYATLVRRYQGSLYRYARRMELDHDTALDLVQDALVRGYMKLRTCAEPDRFGSWVHRILRNGCLDFAKNVRRNSMPLEAAADVTSGGGPDEDAQRAELGAVLREALARLPEEMREAFLMHHHEGWSFREIADVTEVSLSAAKMRVHRARQALRDSLEQAGVQG